MGYFISVEKWIKFDKPFCVLDKETLMQHSDQELCIMWAAPFWTATPQSGCLSVVATLHYTRKVSQMKLCYKQKQNTAQLWMPNVLYCTQSLWGRKYTLKSIFNRCIKVTCISKVFSSTLKFREDTAPLWHYTVVLIYRFTADKQNVPLLVHFTVPLDTKNWEGFSKRYTGVDSCTSLIGPQQTHCLNQAESQLNIKPQIF